MILDAYSGPRGWSEGLRTLGLTDIGIELDDSACRTAVAAGHRTIRADVAQFPLDHLVGRVDGALLSPPCQAFSTAGTGEGRDVIPELAAAIHRGDWRWSHTDDRVRHVLEVGRWTETLHPVWVACEQVPPVLPLWQAYADRWRALYGWSVWCGILNAADYGVPQTRRRAFLIARTDGQPVAPPAPTHTEGGALTMFGELKPWVSMADALGWSDDVTVEHQRGAGMVERHGTRPKRPASSPAPVITAGANLRLVVSTGMNSMKHSRDASDMVPYERPIDEPAPTLDGKVGGAWRIGPEGHRQPPMRWVHERPATTVGRSENTIRLTIRDALILQGFPPDYPVQGTKTKQFEQIGNACPPPLSAHVISAVSGVPFLTEKAA